MKAFHLSRVPILDRDAFIVEASKGKSVLHLGCADAPYFQSRSANGTLLHARLAGVAKEIVGIDFDESGVEFLRRLGFKNVLLGNVEALPELSIGRTFDLVVVGELLEHLPNPGLCLLGVKKLIAENGSLFISVPNAFSIKGFMRVFRGMELVHPDHVFYFSATTLKKLLSLFGYRDVLHAYYVSRSPSLIKRGLDSLLLGPVRLFAPFFSDGLIVEAKVVK